MKIPIKKLKNKFEIPALGLGTFGFGGKTKKLENYDDEEDIKAVGTAIEMGYVHFDTAEAYAEGYSEKILGKGIKNYDRDKLFITSKVSPQNLSHDHLLKSFENSIRRLQTDYLDLYLIHMPNHDIPIEETIKAMDRLKEEGAIKNIGVSNFSIDSFKEAQRFSENDIVVNQIHYSLLFRIPEHTGLLEFCQKNDVLLEAWRPLHYGQLGKAGTKILDGLAEKYKKTPAQVALNWLVSQRNVFTIVKTTSEEHLKENMDALGWEMEKEDIEILRRDFPYQIQRSSALNPS